MILDDYRDYTAWAILLRRDWDDAEYYACNDGHTALFWYRKRARQFRDELIPQLHQKGRVVKVRVRIDILGKE